MTYQEKLTFDSDGYPQTYSVDNNGDGTYEETGYTEITKTVEGYLESVIGVEDSTGDQTWKTTFAYYKKGLLKTITNYSVVDGEFVLDSITTVVWYENPVNGPTGGIMVSYASDEEGNPLPTPFYNLGGLGPRQKIKTPYGLSFGPSAALHPNQKYGAIWHIYFFPRPLSGFKKAPVLFRVSRPWDIFPGAPPTPFPL